MEIDINQQKISIGDKFRIYTDGRETNYGAAKLFRFFAEINLFENGLDKPVMNIKKRFAFFVAKYNITNTDQNKFEFRTSSFWKGHYECQHSSDIYDIYAHRGRKYSVYKNNLQVAWWTKKAVTWFNGDNYKIISNNSCDKNLLITFCLIIDNYTSNDKNKRTVNFNIGRIGPQAKKFDPDWLPQ
jgi:uncharacterized protein YxjI